MRRVALVLPVALSLLLLVAAAPLAAAAGVAGDRAAGVPAGCWSALLAGLLLAHRCCHRLRQDALAAYLLLRDLQEQRRHGRHFAGAAAGEERHQPARGEDTLHRNARQLCQDSDIRLF